MVLDSVGALGDRVHDFVLVVRGAGVDVEGEEFAPFGDGGLENADQDAGSRDGTHRAIP